MTHPSASPVKTSRSLILIVDDEPEILVALSDLLEGEFDIISTTSPHEALTLVRDHPEIAVIISDQRMPGMTGDVFLSQVQDKTDAKSILLTGYADLSVVITALNQGRIQFYVHKPWDSDGLKAMVRESATRFHTEKALFKERFLLQSTLSAAAFDIVFSDAGGRVIRHNINREMDSVVAIQREGDREVLEETLYPEEERDAISAQRREVVVRGKLEQCVPVTRDGITSWLERTRIVLPWPRQADGALLPAGQRWQASFERDVTERRALEQRMRQDDKMRALGTLSGGIAHDFNNLLTAILGSLDLLHDMLPSDGEGDASVPKKLVENAIDSARKGATLTRSLLEFGRPKSSALQAVNVVRLVRNLKELLSQSLNRASDAAGETGKCALDLSHVARRADDLYAQSDPEQLEMALLNLCINARDAMQDGGTVAIHIEEDISAPSAEFVVISVCDEGHGMTPEIAARIFDPFFTTKKLGQGSGLGLSTIYRFVKRCGGDIKVRSAPGQGTCMSLLLPKVPAQGAELAPDMAAIHRETRQLKILLIDDEAPVRLVTEQFLRRSGHEVVSVADGEAGLACLLAGQRFDLAILDLMMPRMSGQECGKRLVQKQPDLRRLYISGYADAAHRPPHHQVLEKPFTRAMLDEAIASIIN